MPDILNRMLKFEYRPACRRSLPASGSSPGADETDALTRRPAHPDRFANVIRHRRAPAGRPRAGFGRTVPPAMRIRLVPGRRAPSARISETETSRLSERPFHGGCRSPGFHASLSVAEPTRPASPEARFSNPHTTGEPQRGGRGPRFPPPQLRVNPTPAAAPLHPTTSPTSRPGLRGAGEGEARGPGPPLPAHATALGRSVGRSAARSLATPSGGGRGAGGRRPRRSLSCRRGATWLILPVAYACLKD